MTKFVLTVAVLLTISPVFWNCQSSEEAVKNSENEVFKIHDEVMPKYDDILKLKKQLRQQITTYDSLKATGSAAAAVRIEEDKAQAIRLNRDLAEADSLMMYWMSHYSNDSVAKLPSADALRYLADQKDKITDVKTKVNSSIEQARQFLGKK